MLGWILGTLCVWRGEVRDVLWGGGADDFCAVTAKERFAKMRVVREDACFYFYASVCFL